MSSRIVRRRRSCLPFLVVVVGICVVCSQQRVAHAYYASSLITTTTTRSHRALRFFQSATTTNFETYSKIHRGYYHCHSRHFQLAVRMNSDDAFDGPMANSTTVSYNPQGKEFGSTTNFANSFISKSTSVRPRSIYNNNNRLSPLSVLPISTTKTLAPPQSTATTTKGGGINWKERLVDISNIASFLCVLDCTILPLISIAITVYSWSVGLLLSGGGALSMNTAATTVATDIVMGTSTSSNSVSINWLVLALSLLNSQLPSISHNIALYFVIPVGLITSIVNYIVGHKQVRFTLLSFLGLVLIYFANSNSISSIDITWLQQHSWGNIVSNMAAAASHEHIHDACGAIVGAATGMLSHTCPSGEGLVHRLTNTLGCVFLLGSNYYGRKYSQGVCVANALSEAWSSSSSTAGDDEDNNRNIMLCRDPRCIDPNCEIINDEMPMERENFFRWEKTLDQSSSIDLID